MKNVISIKSAALLLTATCPLISLARVDQDIKARLNHLETKVQMLEDKINDMTKGDKEQRSPKKASESAHGLKKINTKADLNRVLNEEGVKVFKISTDWCGPCKEIAKDFAEVAKEFEGQVKTYEIDGDNGALFDYFAKEFKVPGFPTVVTVPSKKSKVGPRSKAEYRIFYAQAAKGK